MNHLITNSAVLLTITLFHLTWMLVAVWLGVLFSRILLRNRAANCAYGINLIGLILVTAFIPISITLAVYQFNNSIPSDATLPLAQANAMTSFDSPQDQSRNDSNSNSVSAPLTEQTGGKTGGSVDRQVRGTNKDIALDQRSIQHDGGHKSGKVELHTAATELAHRAENKLLVRISPYLALVYLIGALLMALRVVKSIIACRVILRSAILIDDPAVAQLLSQCLAKIRCHFHPILCTSTRVAVPVVIGILRPMILIPPALVTGLSPEQWESILLHELAHLRRFDHIVVVWQRLIESILFFHPVVWMLSRRLDTDRELCCDDLVLSNGANPLHYAGALCRVAEFVHESRPQPLVVAATGSVSGELVSRVRRVLSEQNRQKNRSARFALVGGWIWVSLPIIAFVVASSYFAVQFARVNYSANSITTSEPSATPEATAPLQDPSTSTGDWLIKDGDNVQLVIRGEVFTLDGTPAQNISVSVRSSFDTEIKATVTNSKFEFATAGLESLTIRAFSPDQTLQAAQSFENWQLREAASTGVRLTLKPSKTIVVSVKDKEKPVPSANVMLVHGWGDRTTAKTDEMGLARFYLPEQKTTASHREKISACRIRSIS